MNSSSHSLGMARTEQDTSSDHFLPPHSTRTLTVPAVGRYFQGWELKLRETNSSVHAQSSFWPFLRYKGKLWLLCTGPHLRGMEADQQQGDFRHQFVLAAGAGFTLIKQTCSRKI